MGDYDVDEQFADLLDLVESMVAAGELELATRKDPAPLANRLMSRLQSERTCGGLADWLLEQNIVSELYLDDDELASRFAPVLVRLSGAEPKAQWNEQLAVRIREAPADLEAWAVFGDWLEQAGDPRGELVQIQVRLAHAPDDVALRRREELFLQRYRGYLLGPLAEAQQVTFAFGFVDAMTIDAVDFVAGRAHPSLAFVRELRLRGTVAQLHAAVGVLPPLATLVLEWNRQPPMDALVLASVPAGLTTLTLAVPLAHLAGLVALALRRLDLMAATTHVAWRAAFPELRELHLLLGIDDPEPLALLFDDPPPRLQRLRVAGNTTRVVLAKLMRSRLWPQLTELDLSGHQRLDPAVFQGDARRFEHLRKLDLRGTNITDVRAPNVVLGPLPLPVRESSEDFYSDDEDDEDDDNDEDNELDDAAEPVDAEQDQAEDDEDDDDDGAPPEVQFDE